MEETRRRMKKQDEILEQLKKEMDVDRLERLSVSKFAAFRKELEKRWKEAGVL
jgi:hypothetical protein